MLARVLWVLAHVWLGGLVIFILVACVSHIVLSPDHAGAFMRVLGWFSPYNIVNYLVVLVMALPGIAMYAIAQKLDPTLGD